MKPLFPLNQKNKNKNKNKLKFSAVVAATEMVKEQRNALDILYVTLDLMLKVSHPFMPFITEELWQRLPGRLDHEALIVQEYPKPV